ncbi:EF-hand domain-containing protein [Aliiglaciecola sp. M165]|uniref:EF-hand domain-containing protein n=1 Tax=Aliiglaciecola sp. M165 TaxID=2593649 RepID=UPI00117E9B2A|nr:EF-hand domain-containing protein [Aliiglaciecola sp. M165]TRY31022.1 hypothetical protein FM019_14190 [Aliiglaciecola sp. M165]
MKKSLLIGLSVFTLALIQATLSAPAYAQSDLISEMDQDEDGMISIREAVANPSLLASFGKIDTDGDGKISLKELEETQLLKQVIKQA